jgi:cytochrome P450
MRAPAPPGPPGDILLTRYLTRSTSAVALFTELGGYGDIASFRLVGRRIYFVKHPDLIRHIYTSRDWVRTSLSRNLLGSFLGEGLFTQEGELHRQQRRLMQPAFHLRRVESYAEAMTDRATRMLDRWEDGEIRDTAHDMMRLTFEIVSKALFDADTGEQARQVDEAFETILRSADWEYPIYTLLPPWVPIRRWGKSRRAYDTLVRITDSIIRERRAAGEDRGDLLSMLLVAQDEDGTRMTDAQVRAQTLSLIFAGHETTANLLCWTWYLLSRHPEVQGRLFAEVDAVLKGRPPALSDLKDLRYTEMVVKEVLRLYPPAWYAERSPLADTELGGYRIPAGACVAISVYVTHRDPRFFEDPEVFRPERFDGVEERTSVSATDSRRWRRSSSRRPSPSVMSSRWPPARG